ncbi:MAG: hypothetical protein JJLCMIEE_00349 [Acidimicrobiales bacterium]|nr:MAG: MFS transporter [Actinomycetota bacterium]MBV6507308.1 hypothetical protein [Acidimicrobiales bacterium]RIK04083.1 MAG: hypothetical protein DCC48_14285 [Acidobacteriota bacterium]
MSRTPSQARVLGGTVVAVVSSVLPAFLVGALSVELRDSLGYDESAAGLLLASFFGAGALSSVFMGRISERVGSLLFLRWAALLTLLVQLGIALLVQSYTALLVGLLVAGLVNAIAQPAANVAVARHVAVSRQGLALAIKQSAMPAASLIAGASLSALVTAYGWQVGFGVGVVVAATALVVLPARAPEITFNGRGRPAEEADERDAPLRALVMLSVAVGLGAAAGVGLVGFLAESAAGAGLAPEVVGPLYACGSALTIVVRLVAGRSADRRPRSSIGVVVTMLGLGAASFLVLAIPAGWAQIAGAPLAFGAAWGWPGLFNLSVIRTNPVAPGRATGVTQTGTYVGAIVGPLLFGMLIDVWSYSAAWIAAAALAWGSALAMLYSRAIIRRARATGEMPSAPAHLPRPAAG